MSRPIFILLVVVLLILAGLVLLSRRTATAPIHAIEKVVTLNTATNAAP